MTLSEELVKRMGRIVKQNCLSQNLRIDLLKILAKDDEFLLDQKVHCLIRKSKDHPVVPCFFPILI